MLRDIEGNNIETFEERNERVAKHTPGPWESRPTAGHDIHGQSAVYSETGKDVAIVYDGDADASLIAAAPEMLEALDEIIAEADQSNGGKGAQLPIVLHIRGLAAAAIRKATGDV